MFGIGIIDDNANNRREFLEIFQEVKESEENVDYDFFISPPLDNINDYSIWITENDITAIILDQKLREQTPYLQYDGHDVIDYLQRNSYKLPVFVVTHVPEEEDLDDRYSEVADIISRREWSRKPIKLAKRIINNGRKYSKVHIEKHIEMDELAEKVSLGEATDDDQKRLKALRNEIQQPFTEQYSNQDEWLDEFSAEIQKLKELERKASEYLKTVE